MSKLHECPMDSISCTCSVVSTHVLWRTGGFSGIGVENSEGMLEWMGTGCGVLGVWVGIPKTTHNTECQALESEQMKP